MATTPDPVNRFSGPVSVEEFQTWFDSDGRLVKESLMRQCLFEGNVEIRFTVARVNYTGSMIVHPYPMLMWTYRRLED